MKNVEIFDMTLEDYEKIKDVLISVFDEFWTPEILKTEIIGENKKYIVAKRDEEIIGFAGIMINFDEAEIMNIITKKSERGKGIGTLLLDKLIENLDNKKVKKVFLEVNEKNTIAIKMYKKAGFEEIGVRKEYYGTSENAILMSKKINNL